jgi:hypothetical protein
LNDYYGELDSEYADNISSRSAELMLKKNMEDLSKLSFMQEAKKGFESGVPLASHPFLMMQGIDPIEFTAQAEEISEEKAKADMIAQLSPEEQQQLMMMEQMMAQQQSQQPQEGTMPMAQFGGQNFGNLSNFIKQAQQTQQTQKPTGIKTNNNGLEYPNPYKEGTPNSLKFEQLRAEGYKFEVNSGNANNVAKFVSTEGGGTITVADSGGEVGFSNIGNNIYFKTSSSQTNQMSIMNSGRVGIGTTSPANKLQVTGGSIGVDSEYMLRDNRNNTIHLQSANTAASNRSLTIGNATYSNIIIPNGNVGIGTTSPGAPLSVVGSYSSSDEIIEIGGGTGANTDFKLKIGAVDQDYIWFQSVKPGDNYYDLVFNPSAGNVGIGVTNPSTKLDVAGDIKADTLIATDLTAGFVPYNKSGVGLDDSKIYTNGTSIAVGQTTFAAGCTITSLTDVSAAGYRLAAMQTAPAARNSTGTLGEIIIDGNHLYVCYATNSWSRVALETAW